MKKIVVLLKKAILCMSLLIFLPVGRSAAENDHLEPVAGAFNNLTLLDDYESRVKEILLKDAPENPLARMVTLPTFDPEASVSIEGEPEEAYRVVYRACTRQIWENEDWREVGVDVNAREIDAVAVGVIVEVFSRAIQQVRYPTEAPFRLYGVAYYFSTGPRAGYTWSPESVSLLGELVAFGEQMIRYARADDEDAPAIRDNLISRGEELIDALDKSAQGERAP